ncbi:hypothetical protein LW135_06720 [Helicobacter sp. faydin-H20]|uniref:DUF4376 domain-containing protein n=1 Tax=Helicobacter anatolicus TaxID=2905874 RepID=UPI001E3AD922|nr:hypothetical protein [Helicobacter anatolicus]MCE3037512.1 hypothetical protein [Helicobacter anatolicus]
MFYQINNNDLLKITGDFKVVGMLDECIFIEDERELKEPFLLLEDLPQSLKNKMQKELEEAKENKIKEINNQCDLLLKTFKSDALGEVYIYDAKLEDQLNLMGLVLAGVDSFFRCQKQEEVFKQNIPHSKEQLKKLYQDALLYKSRIIGYCGELKKRVENCNSIDEIREITWNEIKPAQEEN